MSIVDLAEPKRTRRVDPRPREWIRFAESCPDTGPFDHPDVWLSWLRAHPEVRPAIFERRDASGRVTALLPLYRKGRGLFAAADEALDYQGILARDLDEAVKLLREVVEFCGRQRLNLTLGKVADGSLLHRSLQHPQITAIAWSRRRYWTICPVGEYRRSGDGTILPDLPRKRRRDYRISDRRIREEMPGLVVRHLEGGEIERTHIDQIAELHLRSPYGREELSKFAEPRFRDFLTCLGERESPLVLSMAWEKPGGPLLAFVLGFAGKATLFYYLTSYREERSRLSPGNWIAVEALRHHARSVPGERVWLDLLSGREAYKIRWASEAYFVHRYQVIPKRGTNLPRLWAYSTAYAVKKLKNRCLGLDHCAPFTRRDSP